MHVSGAVEHAINNSPGESEYEAAYIRSLNRRGASKGASHLVSRLPIEAPAQPCVAPIGGRGGTCLTLGAGQWATHLCGRSEGGALHLCRETNSRCLVKRLASFSVLSSLT
ncbi:unnamed protein product, partial [Iphiclides podalirius]